jgi:hypothetical protein
MMRETTQVAFAVGGGLAVAAPFWAAAVLLRSEPLVAAGCAAGVGITVILRGALNYYSYSDLNWMQRV